MKTDIATELIASLKHLLGENKIVILGIMNLLETEEKQEKMMDYLKKNYQSKELMREDNLLKKAQEITKY